MMSLVYSEFVVFIGKNRISGVYYRVFRILGCVIVFNVRIFVLRVFECISILKPICVVLVVFSLLFHELENLLGDLLLGWVILGFIYRV